MAFFPHRLSVGLTFSPAHCFWLGWGKEESGWAHTESGSGLCLSWVSHLMADSPGGSSWGVSLGVWEGPAEDWACWARKEGSNQSPTSCLQIHKQASSMMSLLSKAVFVVRAAVITQGEEQNLSPGTSCCLAPATSLAPTSV